MDDKAGRRNKVSGKRLRKQQGRLPWSFFKTQRNALLTWLLITASFVLVIGILSQVQIPSLSTAPGGVTVIDYSTLLKQLEQDNVKKVTVQGNELTGVLVRPLPEMESKAQSTPNPGMRTVGEEFNAWNRYPNSGSTPQAQLTESNLTIYTRIPIGAEQSLQEQLTQHKVLVNTVSASGPVDWWGLFWRSAPFLFLLVLLIVFMVSRSKKQPTGSFDDRFSRMGRSRARRVDRGRNVSTKKVEGINVFGGGSAEATSSEAPTSIEPPVTFADVAGIDEVRAELEEIVQFLRSPERYHRLGAHIPRGALLVGPPGTGKTLLAKAVAGEAGVPFFCMSASEFVEMFVGVGASRVRDLFNQARQAAPSVIFLDEIDAVGRKRSMRVGGNDERDQTLNQLLVELDGFDDRQAVVVMAATNRVDILDTALLRPGRFDRRITVSMPDRVGREAILKVHTRQTPLHEDVSLTALARITPGMSGADLANLVNEAALAAARRDLEAVNHECFEEALARVQLGALRPLIMSEKERRIIAVHEGGHALVAHYLPEADRVNRVTILPRGQSLGVTQFTSEEDRYNYSRETLMTRIAVALGGRVAEEIVFGPERITTGAENDLQVVTNIARRMVTRWGMSEQVGVVFADYSPESEYALNMRVVEDTNVTGRTLVYDAEGQVRLNGGLPEGHVKYSLSMPSPRVGGGMMMNALIDAEVQRILEEGRAIARKLLDEHHEQLVRLADVLMEREQLDRIQFEALMSDG